METENKLLKDDVNNKQKLIDDMLEHNSNLMQAKNVFAQSNSATKNKDKWKKYCHTTGNNTFRNDRKNEPNVPRDDRLKELQVSFKDLHPVAHQPKPEKKSMIAIRYSMTKNVNGRDVSYGDLAKIRPHPLASTEDLIDHIKPAIRKILTLW